MWKIEMDFFLFDKTVGTAYTEQRLSKIWNWVACHPGGGGGGGVLPMWWVIHMCRGFDPLFSLWQDRARSFWGIFLIHQQQSYLLGYKTTNFYKNRSFWPQIQFFPRSFWVQFSAASGTPPSVFRPSTPPPPGHVTHSLRYWDIGCGWVITYGCFTWMLLLIHVMITMLV